MRLVAATNRNLEQMVGDKGFREDLYFRLEKLGISRNYTLYIEKDDSKELAGS